jgi:hypothetical protein
LSAGFFFAAIGAAVGKAGLAGFEFEFFAADCAGLNRERHSLMIQGQVEAHDSLVENLARQVGPYLSLY